MVMTTRFTLDDDGVRGVWDWSLRLKDLGRVAPAELFSLLVTIDSEPEE